MATPKTNEVIQNALNGVTPDGILSDSKDGIIATTYRDNTIAKGKMFKSSHKFASSLIASATLKFHIDLSATNTAGLKAVITKLSAGLIGEASTITLKEAVGDASYTGGTTFSSFNLNRNSAAVATAVIKEGVTLTGTWTELKSFVSGQAILGGISTQSGVDIRFNTAKNYVIEITNNGAATAAGMFSIEWGETS